MCTGAVTCTDCEADSGGVALPLQGARAVSAYSTNSDQGSTQWLQAQQPYVGEAQAYLTDAMIISDTGTGVAKLV